MAEVLQFRKAERKKAKLRLGIAGPSGSGKTHSSLLIASGLGEKIAMIDTENGSGELEVGKPGIPDYDVLTIQSPFAPEKYTSAIKAAEEAGYEVIIIDSLSHAWAGEGGLLDMQGKIVDTGKANSYTAWRYVTPKHNSLVETMLQSKCHIIATMRSKMEYAIQQNNGKTEVQKIGMGAIQRDGMEYEFTLFIELSNNDHSAIATKDRTSLFDGMIFRPSKKTGGQLLAWLDLRTQEEISSPLPASQTGQQEQPTKEPQNEPGTSSGSGTEETLAQQPENPKDEKVPEAPSLFNDAEIREKILTAMGQTESPDQLKEICDKYRAEYNKLSKESQALILKKKKELLARFKKQNKAA